MKLVYGVGINDLRNDPNYSCTRPSINGKEQRCPIYRTWAHLLERCYSERRHKRQPHYRGCTMCEEWKTFSNFMAWMKNQNYEGKQLDKDILIPGNKVYSPETCIFVTQSLNCLLTNAEASRGDLPIGVSATANKNRTKGFEAKMTQYGKTVFLGYFHTPEEAHEVYKKERSKYILKIAENLTEDDTSDVERTREALERHIEVGLIFK